MFHKMYYSAALVVMLALHPGALVNASDDRSRLIAPKWWRDQPR